MSMYSNDVEKWLLTAGHEKPLQFNLDDKEKLKLAIKLIREETDELEVAIENKDLTEFKDAIVDLQWVINNAIHFSGLRGLELTEYEKRVSWSNWSKYCMSEDEAIETVSRYKKGTHPDKPGHKRIDCIYKAVPNPNPPLDSEELMYVVTRYSDGKIMKSYLYNNPNAV